MVNGNRLQNAIRIVIRTAIPDIDNGHALLIPERSHASRSHAKILIVQLCGSIDDTVGGRHRCHHRISDFISLHRLLTAFLHAFQKNFSCTGTGFFSGAFSAHSVTNQCQNAIWKRPDFDTVLIFLSHITNMCCSCKIQCIPPCFFCLCLLNGIPSQLSAGSFNIAAQCTPNRGRDSISF